MKKIVSVFALLLSLCLSVIVLAACDRDDTDYTTVIPEGSFTVLSPTADAVDVPTSPTITWTAEPNATAYHVEIVHGETVVAETAVSDLQATLTGLTHATRYTLRITAIDAGGETLSRLPARRSDLPPLPRTTPTRPTTRRRARCTTSRATLPRKPRPNFRCT